MNQIDMFLKYDNLYSLKKLIGNTPLVKLGPRLYAKMETFNPSGSVKDRVIHYIVDKALIYGNIDSETILCDATSGNTGIALAMVAAALELRCVIFMPKNMSEERKQMMKVYGAKIIYAPDDDFPGAIALRDAFLRANQNAWSPRQFENPKNIECHQRTTAQEIHKQVVDLGKPWEAFVHGSGTGGTIEGVRRYAMYNKLLTKICMVKPVESPHGIQGIGDCKDFLAKPDNMDCVIKVSTKDAIKRAKLLAKENGLLVGISSGANVVAAERWIKKNNPSGAVVTMLCDRGERYMSIFKDS